MRRWLVGLLVVGLLGGLIAVAAISSLLGVVGAGDYMFGAPCGSVLASTDPRELPPVAVRVSDLDSGLLLSRSSRSASNVGFPRGLGRSPSKRG
jgi:hypothetical protein